MSVLLGHKVSHILKATRRKMTSPCPGDGRAEVDGLGAVKLALGGVVRAARVQGSSLTLLVLSGMMLK